MRTAVNGTIWGGLSKVHGKQYSWQDIVRETAEAGFKGIEMGGSEGRMGPAREVRRFIESSGLQISSWFANVTYNPYPPNKADYEASIRYAGELGVGIVTVCGGFMPNQRRTTSAPDYDMFAGNYARAMKAAKRAGVTLAFHPHRGCVVETIAETREMVRRLPDFRICIDTAHLESCREDALKFISTFGDRIVATHIKDYCWKRDSFVEPGKGDGALDVARCMAALRREGYKGWYTIELDKAWDKFPGKPEPLAVARSCRRWLESHAA